MTIEIIILANSIKHQACCVAGKTIAGEWVRIVADSSGKELTKEQASITNPYGTFLVKPLQKVLLNLTKHAPLLNQPENYINDPKSGWTQNFNLKFEDLSKYTDKPNSLWGDNNDRIPYADITSSKIKIDSSLYLIEGKKATAYLNTYGKRRVSFSYNGLPRFYVSTSKSIIKALINMHSFEIQLSPIG
uniref:dual OB domain-containing protein n=1 Tax=Salmonella enterica TaxID=28901 RepID=UPI00155D9887|nr:hypothetical protein [Salmonella enterica]